MKERKKYMVRVIYVHFYESLTIIDICSEELGPGPGQDKNPHLNHGICVV